MTKTYFSKRNVAALGSIYTDNLRAVIHESLGAPEDVAAELAFRDQQIEALKACIDGGPGPGRSFQDRVWPWVIANTGMLPSSGLESLNRNDNFIYLFLVSSVRVVKALGCDRSAAVRLVDYVYDRDVGEPAQEVGGVRITLSALCSAHNVNEQACAELTLSQLLNLNSPESLDMGPVAPASFQGRVQPWLLECFGEMIASDVAERNERFLEEALELAQALGFSRDLALETVDRIYEQDTEINVQGEIGLVRVHVSAVCLAYQIHEDSAAEKELARVWTKVDKIRKKQAAKPKFSTGSSEQQ